PLVGWSRQPMVFIIVDLPEPDGPMMATNSPRAMSSDTPRRACTSMSPSVYTFRRSRMRMTGMLSCVISSLPGPRLAPARLAEAPADPGHATHSGRRWRAGLGAGDHHLVALGQAIGDGGLLIVAEPALDDAGRQLPVPGEHVHDLVAALPTNRAVGHDQ